MVLIRRHRAPVLLVALLLGAGAAGWYVGERARSVAPEPARLLTQPLRFVASPEHGFRELSTALRIHHYRASSRGVAEHVDVYYDTDALDLLRSGYSLRFRTSGAGDDRAFSLRLEQEPRFLDEGESKLDVREEVDAAVGESIAAGAWERVVELRAAGDVAAALSAVVDELGVAAGALEPRLIGRLARERFDLSDKGRDWFQMDRERWTYRRFGEEAGEPLVVEDVVVDVTLGARDPELVRRVTTMGELGRMVDGVQPTELAPHERAFAALFDP